MKPTFPKFKGVDVTKYFQNFDELGLDLLRRMIILDPARRISMRECLSHPYFNELGEYEKKKYMKFG